MLVNSESDSASAIHRFSRKVRPKASLDCDLLRWQERSVNCNFHVPSVSRSTVADPTGSESDNSDTREKANKIRDRSRHVEIEKENSGIRVAFNFRDCAPGIFILPLRFLRHFRPLPFHGKRISTIAKLFHHLQKIAFRTAPT